MWEYSRLFGWQPCCQFQALNSIINKVSGLRLPSSKHTDENNPCPLHDGVWKSGSRALIILNVGNIWEYWQFHAPAALITGDKFLTPPGIEEGFLGRQARRPVVKVKGKGRLWVLQHCCLEAYCTLTRISSFIHLQMRCTHQAA